MSIVQVEKFQQEPKISTSFVKIRKHGEGSGGINQKWMEVPCKLKRWRLSCKDTETSMTHTALMQWLLQLHSLRGMNIQWPQKQFSGLETGQRYPDNHKSDQLANGFWKSLTVGGKDAYDGAGKICLVSSWQVFANKLASSMQTAGNCSNLFATKPITIRFSALHYLCNLFHIAKARNLKQPLANTLKNQQFSLPPTDPLIHL